MKTTYGIAKIRAAFFKWFRLCKVHEDVIATDWGDFESLLNHESDKDVKK